MALKTVLYTSGTGGAPATTVATTGGIKAVLDACLVDGMNTRTITGVTRSGSTATVTFSGTNNVALTETVEVAGMDQAEYNGRFKVTARTSGSVSFTVTGTPVSPGTFSTATIKHPAAGWTRLDLGTNTAAYRSANLQHWIQVEDNNVYADSGATFRSRLGEGLTALDTGTRVGEQRRQSKTSGTWVLVADPNTFYLVMNASLVFSGGEVSPFNSADAYAFYCSRGQTGETNGLNAFGGTVQTGGYFPTITWPPGANSGYANPGMEFLRGFAAAPAPAYGHFLCNADVGSVGSTSNTGLPLMQYALMPSPADGSTVCLPFILVEQTATALATRGTLRGALQPIGYLPTEMFTNNVCRMDDTLVGGTLKSLALVRAGVSGRTQLAFDLGDW